MSLPYPGWSVVYGEQPTAAKWSEIGANDDALAAGTGINSNVVDASKIKWAATGANAGIWWEEIGRTTLGSTSTTLAVSSLPARKYLRIMISTFPVATTSIGVQFNGDTGANYAFQWNVANNTSNTTGISTSVSAINITPLNTASGDTNLGTYDIFNPSGSQKLITGNLQLTGPSAANYDAVQNTWGHWVNSSQISTITFTGSTNALGSGSEIVVLGHN